MLGADTLTVVAGAHNQHAAQGYLYVCALDGLTQEAIVHDYLIGTSSMLDGVNALAYTVEPLSFAGIGDGTHTDLDEDGRCDLDGLEYSKVADRLVIPRFLGQSAVLESELILVDLTGGAGFTCMVDLALFNDNELELSFEYLFQCWEKTPLLNVTFAFDNTFLHNLAYNDPDEILGAPTLEAGWILLDGSYANDIYTTIQDPAVACFLIESRTDTGTSAGVPPIRQGEQGNGCLLPGGGRASERKP